MEDPFDSPGYFGYPEPPRRAATDAPENVPPATDDRVFSGPRYCRVCGAPLDPASLTCAQCAELPASAGALSARSTGARTIASGVVLYFVLLLSSVATWLICETEAAAWLLGGMVDTIIVLVWFGWHWQRLGSGLLTLPSLGWYAASLGVGGATFLLATVLIEVAVSLLGVEEILIVHPMLAAGHGWIAILLVGAVQPAIVEELAFRGVILSGLMGPLTTKEAIVVSALLFMTIHLTIAGFPHLFLIGLLLGYFRVASGSLYPGMLLHFTHNLLCLVFETPGWGLGNAA